MAWICALRRRIRSVWLVSAGISYLKSAIIFRGMDIHRCIYDRNGSEIYDISDGRVVKIIHDLSSFELTVVRFLVDMNPRLRSCVDILTVASDRYEMRRYDGHIEVGAYGRRHWRSIGRQCLAFLEDFHHVTGMAHMDIKKANILVDRQSDTFHVGDFGNAEYPWREPRLLREFDAKTKWYYLAMGGELDQPLYSWRMDLVALGHVLASLQFNYVGRYETECWSKREGRGTLTDDATLELRSAEIKEALALEPYFSRLTIVPWSAAAPPPRAFYQELAALLGHNT